MKKKDLKTNRGYTIIETMIATSLFIVVVLAGTGALLNANLLHQKSRDMRSIIDSLSFVMEDMSKSLRTGEKYHCITSGGFSGLTTALSCPSGGGGISFKSAAPSSQWVYYVGTNINGLDPVTRIFKSIDDGATFVQLTPDEVIIDPLSSGFIVVGAEPPPGDIKQPFVTIKLKGRITFKEIDTPFSLQTAVSQRLIDVDTN